MKLSSWTLGVVLGASLSLASAARAQEAPPSPEGGSRLEQVERWKIEPELKQLSRSLQSFKPLVSTLGRANKDLAKAYQAYSQSPGDELLASRVEVKLARYARGLNREFQRFEARQDAIGLSLRELNFKLGSIARDIRQRSQGFRSQLKQYKGLVNKLNRQLITRAQRLRELAADPSADPKEVARLKQEFVSMLNDLKYARRYERGYSRRYAGYERLETTLDKLQGAFKTLEGRVSIMVENLGAERRFLKDAMRFQLDAIEMKRFNKEISGQGRDTVLDMTEKLSTLFNKVTTFSKVHDQLANNFDDYFTDDGNFSKLVKGIEGIGGAGPLETDKDLDKLIDKYSKLDPLDLEAEEGGE